MNREYILAPIIIVNFTFLLYFYTAGHSNETVITHNVTNRIYTNETITECVNFEEVSNLTVDSKNFWKIKRDISKFKYDTTYKGIGTYLFPLIRFSEQ